MERKRRRRRSRYWLWKRKKKEHIKHVWGYYTPLKLVKRKCLCVRQVRHKCSVLGPEPAWRVDQETNLVRVRQIDRFSHDPGLTRMTWSVLIWLAEPWPAEPFFFFFHFSVFQIHFYIRFPNLFSTHFWTLFGQSQISTSSSLMSGESICTSSAREGSSSSEPRLTSSSDPQLTHVWSIRLRVTHGWSSSSDHGRQVRRPQCT